MIRNKLIKLLGGHTDKEYKRLEAHCQALMDSKTTDEAIALIINEYQYRLLAALYRYTKFLYGTSESIWCNRVFNVIRNNWLKINVRYVSVGSRSIFHLDTTLDEKNQYDKIMSKEGIDSPEDY